MSKSVVVQIPDSMVEESAAKELKSLRAKVDRQAKRIQALETELINGKTAIERAHALREYVKDLFEIYEEGW